MYDYNCLMLDFAIPDWDIWKDRISVEDLAECEWPSLPSDPHCTILYGLHQDVRHVLIKKYCPELGMFRFKVNSIDVFQNASYDVLHYRIESEWATRLNRTLRLNFPHENLFETYIQHITIAYLKKGTFSKYIAEETDFGHYLIPYQYKYSYYNGNIEIWQ